MTGTQPTLPDFISPMLAKPGTAFDSEDHLFEIKWDGTRSLLLVDQDGYRLLNRRRANMKPKYPEFAKVAERLPPGTVLDGEVVVLNKDGKSVFSSLQARDQARDARRFQMLSKTSPASFMAFDCLYANYQPLLKLPLAERREALKIVTQPLANGSLILSDGIVGQGKLYFQQAVERDLEGIVAKRLDSRYLPGKRSDAWLKIKKRQSILCAIIGYVPKPNDLESLIIAAPENGQLRCIGRVGNGFGEAKRMEILKLLTARQCQKPLVKCEVNGTWVKPGLYCSVRYLEKTINGELREPVFEQLVVEDQT